MIFPPPNKILSPSACMYVQIMYKSSGERLLARFHFSFSDCQNLIGELEPAGSLMPSSSHPEHESQHRAFLVGTRIYSCSTYPFLPLATPVYGSELALGYTGSIVCDSSGSMS